MKKAYLITFPNGDRIVCHTMNNVVPLLRVVGIGYEEMNELVVEMRKLEPKAFTKYKFEPWESQIKGIKIETIPFYGNR